jgi:hypothetical protein
MAEKKEIINVMILGALLIIAFFLGGIWTKMVLNCGASKGWSQTDGKKFCPLTQKGSATDKGSTLQ